MMRLILFLLMAAAAWAQAPVQTSVICTDSGGDDTYTPTCTSTVTGYYERQVIYLITSAANTGACTLQIGSLAAISIRHGSGDPADGAIPGGLKVVTLRYDGAVFQIASSGASGGSANLQQGDGITLSGTNPVVIGTDPLSTPLYSSGSAAPAGTGAVGEMYFRTADNTLYVGTGSGWAIVTAVASVTPGSAGQFYITNGSGASAWGNLNVGTGLSKAFATATATLSVDTAVVPTLGGNNAWTGRKITTPSAAQTLVAGTAIVADAELVQVTSASDVTLTAVPTIAAGTDGEWLTILNVGSYAITLQDRTELASSNLCLGDSANFELKAKSGMRLVSSTTGGCWIQVGGGGTVVAGAGATWAATTGTWAATTSTWAAI